jgi:ABC-type cobalamin/Fe3+-siderophores transport system ATPase subunit
MSEIAVLVTSFTTTTVLTMLGMVLLGRYGYSTLFNTDKLERYMGW